MDRSGSVDISRLAERGFLRQPGSTELDRARVTAFYLPPQARLSAPSVLVGRCSLHVQKEFFVDQAVRLRNGRLVPVGRTLRSICPHRRLHHRPGPQLTRERARRDGMADVGLYMRPGSGLELTLRKSSPGFPGRPVDWYQRGVVTGPPPKETPKQRTAVVKSMDFFRGFMPRPTSPLVQGPQPILVQTPTEPEPKGEMDAAGVPSGSIWDQETLGINNKYLVGGGLGFLALVMLSGRRR